MDEMTSSYVLCIMFFFSLCVGRDYVSSSELRGD